MKNIPAFPKPFSEDRFGGDRPEKFYAQDGMDLRDYFAGKALIAFMSNSVWVKGLDEECYQNRSNFKESMAIQCYVMADELLKARDIK